MTNFHIETGDALTVLKTMETGKVNCVVTSPPYFGLRDYGHPQQIGSEETPQDYVTALVRVFDEVRRVLTDDGTVWLNLGDSYASAGTSKSGFKDGRANREERKRAGVPDGIKPKDLIGIPWMVAFALRAAGWYLRQDLIWSKPNPMPESVRDRCTKSHEYLFLLTKSYKYYYDHEAIKEDCSPSNVADYLSRRKMGNKGTGTGSYESTRPDLNRSRDEYMPKDFKRNRRSVWEITPKPFAGAHFATFPPQLVEPCILAGCPVGGLVLDPFSGAGTTAMVATQLNRCAIGIELNPDYAEMSRLRIIDNQRLI